MRTGWPAILALFCSKSFPLAAILPILLSSNRLFVLALQYSVLLAAIGRQIIFVLPWASL